MSYFVRTKKGVHIVDGTCKNYRVDAYVGEGEYASYDEAKKDNKSIVINQDLRTQIVEDKDLFFINECTTKVLTLNDNVKMEGGCISTLTIYGGNIYIKDATINHLFIRSLKGSIIIEDSVFNTIDIAPAIVNDFRLLIRNNKVKECFKIHSISVDNYVKTILIESNSFHNATIQIDLEQLNEKDICVSFDHNHLFNSTMHSNFPYLQYFENRVNNEEIIDSLNNEENNVQIKFLKETGYPYPNSFRYLSKTVSLKPYVKLDVKNICQYTGNELDPILQTGCEITSATILVNYIFHKNYNKNQLVPYLEFAMKNEKSFWDAFIGDIYHDGWGCMSPVIEKALNKFLITNQLDKEFQVINHTSTPLINLLSYLDLNIPVLAYATMGNETTMYSRRYASTVFTLENSSTIAWPGNDHAVVILGYNLNKNEIYLADPELGNNEIRIRNLTLFENRFTQLYKQSIVIVKKNNKA